MVPLAQSSGGSGQYSTLIFLALMGAVFYFLLIRPQQRNRRRQAQLLSSLEEGDEVQTIGGMFGTIREIDEGDGTVLLEVAPEVEVRFIRGAIARKLVYDEDAEEGQEQDQDEEQEEGAGEQK
jgi:preprotein translocase subunit YajC